MTEPVTITDSSALVRRSILGGVLLGLLIGGGIAWMNRCEQLFWLEWFGPTQQLKTSLTPPGREMFFLCPTTPSQPVSPLTPNPVEWIELPDDPSPHASPRS